MNKQRRKALQIVFDKLREIEEELETLLEQEEEYRDNMPENLQTSEKYEKTEETIYSLEAAIELINNAADEIEAVIE